MSDNPFQTPQKDYLASPGVNVGGGLPGKGFVQQITVVSILMMVQGGLLLVMTAALTLYSLLFANIENFGGPNAPNDVPPEFSFWMSFGIGVFAAFALLLSLMFFLSGFWGLQYKGRLFGITTLILGVLASCTFYCAPTAIGIAIYGLIVYFSTPATQAFTMRSEGIEKDEILSRFY